VAYLGNTLQVAFPSYRNIDDVSGSFNGVTTTFPLRVSGAAPVPFPISSNQCLISVGGVVQRPDDSGTEGFRISGTNIIFSSAPASGADFFGVILAGADYVNVGANFPSGSATVPSITFDNDLDTGIYNPNANEIGFTTAGTARLIIDANGQVRTGGLGTANNPVYTFNSDPNTGIYSPGADQVSISTNGTERLRIDATGQVEAVSLGTAAAPVYSFTTDPNTGLYSPGADQVAISTNSVGRLFIDASGNVGVGTSSLSHRLVVSQNNSGGVAAIHLPEDESTILGSTANTNIKMGGNMTVSAGGVLGFNTNGSERLRITSDGKLGLGTSSPSAPLTFVGSTGRKVGFYQGTEGYSIGVESSEFRFVTDAAGIFTFRNGGTYSSSTEYMRIDASGRVGIGVTDPGSYYPEWNQLVVGNNSASRGITIVSGSSYQGTLAFADGTSLTDRYRGYIQYDHVSDSIYVGTAATERFRCDSSGRLLVGTSSTVRDSRLCVRGNASGTFTADVEVGAAAGFASISAGNTIGVIRFTEQTNGGMFAQLYCEADGTPGNGDYPGRLVFSTCSDGSASPSERMRIRSDGNVLVGSTTVNAGIGNTSSGITLAAEGYLACSRSAAQPLYVNRSSDDGTLVDLRQDGNTEGTISVSGTTVSYNGAHLSRWSQLPGGAERTKILRGSVLSNIDEMCVWGDEDNEQLNRMKVSVVEGDPNVSGVFQSWDDDDDTYTDDFYCAMTGDFIIRIAEGVTVQRGDLLMSAGDGTAKPQDDDIIRSKTIAKVTSTHITCTYDDGSYCVPCVLMAC
jgi:hypothetical protein